MGPNGTQLANKRQNGRTWWKLQTSGTFPKMSGLEGKAKCNTMRVVKHFTGLEVFGVDGEAAVVEDTLMKFRFVVNGEMTTGANSQSPS